MIQLIQKVPLLMKEENNESYEDYEPKVVSFGPYHRGKEKLKFVEDFKPRAVEMFIGEGGNESVYIDAILREIQHVRSCYLEESTMMYTDEQLARMMLLDGCVILNYIGPSKTERSSKEALTINGYLGTAVYKSIRRDMYLLENQVPLRVLEILVGLRYGTSKDAFTKDMENYSFKMFFNAKKGIPEDARKMEINNLGKKALHLLEIFRRVIVIGHNGREHLPKNTHFCNINNLLSCLKCCCKCDDGSNERLLYLLRSVTDLKSKAIHFRASQIKSLKAIRLKPSKLGLSAELQLPSLYIDMHTRVFIKNVIAYEFSPTSVSDQYVTAYAHVMKRLVVSKEDVKELRDKHIIMNELENDEQVVQLYKDFNTYGTTMAINEWEFIFDMKSHFNSNIKMWMADLKTRYFDNPWSIFALAGSIFLIFLDIVQTYFAAFQPASTK